MAKRTEINEYGEFGLIKHLTEKFKIKNPSTKKGVGDDAAILEYGNKQTLITTNLLLEGINFDLTYTPLKHLGYKAAITGFSNIYAMFGSPKQLLVSIGISKRFSVEDIEELYKGIQLACEIYSVDLIGGDTSASMTGLTISITCTGEIEKYRAVLRSGAKENDLICVSGDLGAAYMGLQLLEREKIAFNKSQETDPQLETHEYILERQLKPEAKKEIIETLKEKGITPTSMIDVSNGLASDILQICDKSNCGCSIYEERIPIDYQTAAMCDEMNMNLTTIALNGGEDYELLFTVPLSMHEKILTVESVKIIGHINKKETGIQLITRDGQEIEITAQGWK